MRRAAALLLMAALVLLVPAAPAVAHTEFESSEPADHEVVEGPLSEIAVVFTLPVTIVGNGFEVLDPQGVVVNPEVESNDGTVFTLVLNEPIADGDVGVRYEVAAEDGHVLADSFSFTVTASAATSTTTSAPATTTSGADVTASSTSAHPPTTPAFAATTPPTEGDGEGSAAPLLIGLGVVLVGGFGIYAGMRSRS